MPKNLWFMASSAVAVVVAVTGAYMLGGQVAKSNPYINKVLPVGNISAIVQDASKRNTFVTNEGLSCAEPPPDVIGSIAVQLSAKVGGEQQGVGSGSADLAHQFKTATEQLVKRSQGIQVLRDMMYRLCEAKQNGVLEEKMYRSAMFHLLASLNFVVPFEQCLSIANNISQEILNACFAEVNKHSNAMAVSIKAESELHAQNAGLASQISETKEENEAYHRALHFVMLSSGLPSGLIPENYHSQLVRDLNRGVAKVFLSETAKYPYYLPNDLGESPTLSESMIDVLERLRNDSNLEKSLHAALFEES